MSEGMPSEGQHPLTRAQIRQLRRSLTERILERAESDPEWRQLLLDDPELAMREANFPETRQLAQQGAPQEAEVTGQFYGNLRRTKRLGSYIGYGDEELPQGGCRVRRYDWGRVVRRTY